MFIGFFPGWGSWCCVYLILFHAIVSLPWCIVYDINFQNIVKPLKRGHLRVLKSLSVIETCRLLGGNFKKILSVIHSMSAIWDVRYWEVSLLKANCKKYQRIQKVFRFCLIQFINIVSIFTIFTDYHSLLYRGLKLWQFVC